MQGILLCINFPGKTVIRLSAGTKLLDDNSTRVHKANGGNNNNIYFYLL